MDEGWPNQLQGVLVKILTRGLQITWRWSLYCIWRTFFNQKPPGRYVLLYHVNGTVTQLLKTVKQYSGQKTCFQYADVGGRKKNTKLFRNSASNICINKSLIFCETLFPLSCNVGFTSETWFSRTFDCSLNAPYKRCIKLFIRTQLPSCIEHQ